MLRVVVLLVAETRVKVKLDAGGGRIGFNIFFRI